MKPFYTSNHYRIINSIHFNSVYTKPIFCMCAFFTSKHCSVPNPQVSLQPRPPYRFRVTPQGTLPYQNAIFTFCCFCSQHITIMLNLLNNFCSVIIVGHIVYLLCVFVVYFLCIYEYFIYVCWIFFHVFAICCVHLEFVYSPARWRTSLLAQLGQASGAELGQLETGSQPAGFPCSLRSPLHTHTHTRWGAKHSEHTHRQQHTHSQQHKHVVGHD